MITLLTLPALSEVALLAPVVVLESDWEWDCDEVPAASSPLDACNESLYIKRLHMAPVFHLSH